MLNRIHDGPIDNATAQTCVRNTIDEKAPEVFTDTIHDRLAAFFKNHAANVDRTRNVLHQVVYVTSIQWKVRDLCRIDCRGQSGILSVYWIGRRRCAADLDRFMTTGYSEREINAQDCSSFDGQDATSRGCKTVG